LEVGLQNATKEKIIASGNIREIIPKKVNQ
jgi:hypothetical protein